MGRAKRVARVGCNCEKAERFARVGVACEKVCECVRELRVFTCSMGRAKKVGVLVGVVRK